MCPAGGRAGRHAEQRAATTAAPAMVLQADQDLATIDHDAAVMADLGNPGLAVLAGTHAVALPSALVSDELHAILFV